MSLRTTKNRSKPVALVRLCFNDRPVLFALALVLGVVGGLAARTLGISPPPITLAALALFSVAIGWTGWEMRRTIDS